MPRHISRVIILMVTLGVAAFVAIRALTVDSFYRYGHYRGDSVAEIASQTPNYKGTAFCEPCHREQVALWSNGAHSRADAGKAVRCEVCHGAAGNRSAGGPMAASAAAAEHPKNLKLIVPDDTRQLCTLCHEKTAGRPAQQPQIMVADHARDQQCTACHNPHSPLLGLVAAVPAGRPGDAAKGKASAAACAGCHDSADARDTQLGPNLAGQNEGYLVEAITAYVMGARVDPMMAAATRKLTNTDIADLASYYAGLTCQSTLTADKQVAASAQATASKCAACHGADGASANRAWPNLVGQTKQHLVDALNAYRSGARKNAMMAGVVKDMSDAEVETVSAYYAAATCK